MKFFAMSLFFLSLNGWTILRQDVVNNQNWTHSGTVCRGNIAGGGALGNPPGPFVDASFESQTALEALAAQQDNIAAGLEFCIENSILNFTGFTPIAAAGIGGAWLSDQDNNISTCRLVTTGPAGQVTLNGLQTAGQIVCNSNY